MRPAPSRTERVARVAGLLVLVLVVTITVVGHVVGPTVPPGRPAAVQTLPRTAEPTTPTRRPAPAPTAIQPAPPGEDAPAVVVEYENGNDGESRFCSRRWWC